MKQRQSGEIFIRVLALFACMVSVSQPVYALDVMSEEEMSQTTGQGEFLTMTKIGTTDYGNPNSNVAFTRVTLNAQIDINSNIKKLRLGCDTANYTNCDISIDQLSLTGKVPAQRIDGQPNNFPQYGNVSQKLDSTKALESQFYTPANQGPNTDFVMDNPFIELAIQNPESLTDRKMVGYRFGAHEVWGAMSTGTGPTRADGTAPVPEIFGPIDCNDGRCDSYDPNVPTKSFGTGADAVANLYEMINSSASNNAERDRRFAEVTKKWVSYSNGLGHTGVNSISGRLPVRLDNFNLAAVVRDATFLNINTEARTAIVSGRLSRLDPSDFGRIRNGGTNANGTYDTGYLRNVFTGDTDTYYNNNTWGNYLANDNNNRQGRAPTFKRASKADLSGMIVHVHGGLANLVGGDRFNNQTINTNLFHQLEFGAGDSYTPGSGAKHMAFQYQTLDGLQWITTDKRIASAYDGNGNPAVGSTPVGPYGGYDWLSTRAGWWLESPQADVRNAFVPAGQIVNRDAPDANEPIILGNIDLGQRPVDNCYGNLRFC